LNIFKKWLVVVCIAFALVGTSAAEAKRQNQTIAFSPQVEKQVRLAFARTPVMVKIARCESGFRQHDGRGAPLKNKHSTATGAFQVMYSLHHKNASRLGFNLKTTQGNIGYAKYLYRTEGTRPWRASKHCWG
jgi:hypothetical protein